MDFTVLFQKFSGLKIAVVGDVMIDAYLVGKVTRISPEAPVPIVNLKQEEDRLGGAANVAMNLIALGASPIMCTVVGNDKYGSVILDLFEKSGVSTTGVVQSKDRITTVKTRVLGNNQQLVRIDSEQTDLLNTEIEDLLIARFQELVKQGLDAVIFEDYNKGVLTPKVIRSIIRICIENNIPTTVDPKKDQFFDYQGVTLFKPNLKELMEGVERTIDMQNDPKSLIDAVEILENKLQNEISLITLSEFGVYIKKGEKAHQFPAHLRNIADVSGAGDTVISVATLCLAIGLDISYIAQIANLAGGLVCEETGVVSINKERLLNETSKLVH